MPGHPNQKANIRRMEIISTVVIIFSVIFLGWALLRGDIILVTSSIAAACIGAILQGVALRRKNRT